MTDNRTTELLDGLRSVGNLHEFAELFGFNWEDDSDWTWHDVAVKMADELEQAIAATLGSDASAVRLAERLRSIAYEMRSVGASSMTPHELLACYANDVDKVADSLMFAATLGNSRAERICKQSRLFNLVWSECSSKSYEWHGNELPNYCPNCGAKVVDE